MPELFDLESAFDRLADEVSGRPGPGAEPAMRAASRRRTTGWVAAAAAVAVIAAGAAYLGSPGRPSALQPADATVPKSVALTAERLSEATAGWVTGWRLDNSVRDQAINNAVPACLNQVQPTGMEAQARSVSLFRTDFNDAAISISLDSTGPAQARQGYDSLRTMLRNCPGLTEHHAANTYPAGTATSTLTLVGASATASGHSDVWLTLTGSHLGLLAISPADGSAPSAEVAGRVERLALAASQTIVDTGLVQSESSSATASASAATALGVDSAADLDAALEGWAPLLSDKEAATPPCLDPTWMAGAPTGGSGVGSRYTYDLGTWSAGASIQKAGSVVQGFLQCNSVQMESAEFGDVVGAVDVSLWRYDLGGNKGQGAAWLAVSPSSVGILSVEPGRTPVTDKVAREVAVAWAKVVLAREAQR